MVERRLIVHPSGVNPVLYSAATLKGYGLQEDDLTKAFSRLIRRKISQREPIAFPPEAQDLIDLLDPYKPLSSIYNAISWSNNTKFGYVTVGCFFTTSESMNSHTQSNS